MPKISSSVVCPSCLSKKSKHYSLFNNKSHIDLRICLTRLMEDNNFKVLNVKTFHLVHTNTLFQKIISPIMFLLKIKQKKYRP